VITKPHKSDEHAFCSVDTSRGNRQDITSHIATANSQTYQLCKGLRRNVATQCRQSVPALVALTRSVVRVETLLTGAIVEHTLPVAFADHFGQLLRRMVPESGLTR